MLRNACIDIIICIYNLSVFSDLSFENLQWLSIEQIIGDIATFAAFLREEYLTDDVGVWGSGIGATLAAWSRLKNPHLINGAWSSSGIFEISISTSGNYRYTGLTATTLSN